MEGEEGSSSSWLLRPKLSTSVYMKSSSCRESSRVMKSSAEPKLDSSSSSTSQPRSSTSRELSSAPSLAPGSETKKGSSSKNSTSKPKPALKSLESAPTPTSASASTSCSFSFYPDGCPELSSKFSDSNLPPTPSIIMAKPGPVDARSENAPPPKSRQRSSSPMPPATVLSDAFKEAVSVGRKRFSTPPRSGKGSRHGPPADHRDSSPMRYLSSMKAAIGKHKARGGRVAAAEERTIDLCRLYIGLRFASGAHSRLYHGMYEDQPVAVKIVRQPDEDEDDNGVMAARLEKQFTREVTFLSRLSHRNVIKLEGACRTPPIFCIITEYLSGGSLRSFLHKLEHKSLPLKEMIAIGLQIARGLEYIHSQGIIHRDIKPENILFDKDSCVKIADFGTACEEAHCDVLADDPGTYRWMAPEMLKHKAYGRKVDVYSFGLILWEMVAGTIPYEDMSPIQAAFAVVNKNLRPKIPAGCPAAVQALIEHCWALHPEKRPEFCQIVKVIEQFESMFAREGTLDQLQKLTSLDHKKGLHNWIQKLKPLHADVSGPPVPKFL